MPALKKKSVESPYIICTRLPKLPEYQISDLTGLAARCDWFINGSQLVNITSTDTPQTIFLTGYQGGAGIDYLATQLLPKLTIRFILIIASEDYTFPNGTGDSRNKTYSQVQDQIAMILESPLLVHVFVENLDDPNHPKMSPIPLGLLNPNIQLDLADRKTLYINMNSKPIKCFCAHRIRSSPIQWDDRKLVRSYSIGRGPWAKFVKYIDRSIPHPEFIKLLEKSQFSLCVHGGGYDPNPRFTESILAGAIPIIQHSPLDKVFSRFPVVFVDKWTPDALTLEFLEQKLAELRPYYEDPEKRCEVLKMLTLDYWWSEIMAKLG
jgi:hypothetical protein